MKRKYFALIVGVVAFAGWCLWWGQTPRLQPPVSDTSRQPRVESHHPAVLRTARPAEVDPVKAERFLERVGIDLMVVVSESDPGRRDDRLQVLLESIPFNDIPSVLPFLQTQEQTQLLQDFQVLLIRKAASIDPQAAAAWAQQIPPGTVRAASIAGVGVVWANRDLPAAARWASILAEGEDRENGLRQVIFEGARTQPSVALQLTDNLAPNAARDELVRHAARQWASQDPSATIDWAKEMKNPVLREQVLADVAAAWADSDPRSAAAFALKSLSAGKFQEDALTEIAQHWVQKEPERAAAWVLELPETLQVTALANVIRLWADKDARQTEKWIQNLPPGSQREVALNAFSANEAK